MKNTLILFLFIFITLAANCQINYPTRDSVHIFWQPGTKITYLDFKGSIPPKIQQQMDNYDYSAIAFVGIWHVIDLPTGNRKKRWSKFEKVYFAPAFERTTSATRTTDSIEIAKQVMYFDICEVWARWAREQLAQLKDSINATGIQAIMYTTIVQRMNKNYNSMCGDYTEQVFIDKEEGSYLKWRAFIDEWLDETQKYATTPEECYRLMSGKPIEKGYKKAKKLMGPIPDKQTKAN